MSTSIRSLQRAWRRGDRLVEPGQQRERDRLRGRRRAEVVRDLQPPEPQHGGRGRAHPADAQAAPQRLRQRADRVEAVLAAGELGEPRRAAASPNARFSITVSSITLTSCSRASASSSLRRRSDITRPVGFWHVGVMCSSAHRVPLEHAPQRVGARAAVVEVERREPRAGARKGLDHAGIGRRLERDEVARRSARARRSG